MRKTPFLILSLIFSFLSLRSQSLYEITFENSDIVYKGFLVYFNEQEAFMRIGYTYENKYNVVNVNYVSATGQESGYNFFVMVGSNPRFITKDENGQGYNPDHFLWIWDDKDNSNLPYITDDPDFDPNKLYQCSSYTEIDPKKLTDDYLKQFFYTNEPEYIALQKMRQGANQTQVNTNTNNNNTNNNTTNTSTSSAAKLHLVLFINTEIPDIGQSCSMDQKVMETELREISKAVGISMQKYVVNGEKFSKAEAQRTINEMKIGRNDVVFFYYSGHGFRWSNQTDRYPQFDMRYSEYTPLSEQTALAFSDVAKAISAKGARLNILMSDCCNSDIGRNQMTSTNFMSSRSFQGAEITKLKKLFLNSTGTITLSGSSPGEYSWCNVNGGFFTLSFIQALKEEIGYMRNESPTWEHIAQKTVKSTQYKASNCNGCKPQNPFFTAKITQN